jgi:hypothetical protein
MFHRLLRVVVLLVSAALIMGLSVTTAEARGLPRVSGIAKAGQDWKNAKLKIRWAQVRSARYVVRLSTSPKGLKRGRVLRTRASAVYTPRLNRNATYFVQVRAIRGGAKSRWSRIARVRFSRPTGGVYVPNPGPGIPAGGAGTLIRATFDNLPNGVISPANFKSTLGGTYGQASYYDDTSIVPVAGRGKVIRTKLDAGTYKQAPAGNNGATMFIQLRRVVTRACMSYDIRFSNGFDWSLGGKLPGLEGVAPGTSAGYPTGGKVAGDKGWSGRLMWLGPRAYSWAGPSNGAVTYMYNPTQGGTYGDNVRWNRGFVAGSWHDIQVCYKMNTVGRSDGSLQTWMDGRLVVNNNAYKYRTRNDVGVSHLLWHIFRGGADSNWAGKTTGYVDIDNFTVTS